MIVDVAESGTRSRTRRAILDAAMSVWGRDPAASLGDIAQQAQVGRTTLHRYFPDRSDLQAALAHDVVTRVDAAAVRSRLDEGPAADALVRLCHEYFDLADVLAVMFNEAQLVNEQSFTEAGCVAGDLGPVVERGHRDGSVDDELTTAWVENVMWAMLYASWQLQRFGDVTKSAAVSMLTRSFRRAIDARS